MDIDIDKADGQNELCTDEDTATLAASLRATHVWFGPHSPIHEPKERELDYLHIFFPQHIM